MQQKLLQPLLIFKNLEFNQSNVELFERQAESDRARLKEER